MVYLTKKETWAKLLQVKIVASDMPGENFVLDGMDFNAYDFEGMDLSHVSFVEAQFIHTLFSFSNFRNADLSYIEAANGIFSCNDFRRATFLGANLESVDFDNCNLEYATFISSYLRGAIFHNCNLRHVNFTGAFLQESSLTGSDLTGAILTKADLSRVDLSQTTYNSDDLADALLNEKTYHQIRADECPDNGRRIVVRGSRNWTMKLTGLQGTLLGPSTNARTDDIQLDTGEIIQLYTEEYSFID